MSRTDNTMPIRIQEEDGRDAMWTAGGVYAGIGKHARYEEKSARQKVRLALVRGEEPEPTRHRHGVKWRWW